MKATPISLLPLALCILAVGLFAASLWLTMTFELDARTHLPGIEDHKTVEVMDAEPIQYHDESLASLAKETVSKRSGFDPMRSEYSRAVIRSSQSASAPTPDPKFVGMIGRGADAKVMIAWTTGAEPQVHSIGDDTPWGILEAVEGTQVVFEDNGKEHQLSKF